MLRPWPHKRVRWALLSLGGGLLLHSLWLVSVHVTHTGVMVPALIALVLLALALWGAAWQRWVHSRAWRVQLWHWGRWGFALWALSVVAYFLWLTKLGTGRPPPQVPQAMVVLGSTALQGKPSPTLAERLNVAYQWAQQYPRIPVVVSGGMDLGQTVTEAQAMADYLQARGLSARRIVLEDKSTSTHENLVFSARLLRSAGVNQDDPVLLVTSDFHTPRAQWIAAKAGWTHLYATGATTPLYLRYNAWLREYFACISGWLFREY